MINIVIGLALFFVVKLVFVYLFVSRDERNLLLGSLVPQKKAAAFLVERHDRHAIGSPLRSEVQGLKYLGVREIDNSTYTLIAHRGDS